MPSKPLSADQTTRVAADALAQSDYRYDVYLTKDKDEKAPPVTATHVPVDGIDAKRAKTIESVARAQAEGIRTVRDLGNAPSNLLTPTRLAERAQQVAKSVGVKCAVHSPNPNGAGSALKKTSSPVNAPASHAS